MNEYIIINKTAIQKRIEELEKQLNTLGHTSQEEIHAQGYLSGKIQQLREILSQSTPLIPEIEKHSIEFTKNLLNCTVSEAKSIDNIKEYHPKEYQLLLGELELNGKKIFENYISNLKLDI